MTIEATNSPVREGKTLRVDATVESTGGSAGAQEVTRSAGGATRDTAEVALDPGESRTVSLEWTTVDGDSGDYSAEVASEDDAASRSVRFGAATPTPESTPEPTAATDAATAASTESPAPAGTATRAGGDPADTSTATDGDTTGDGAGPGVLVVVAALAAVAALRRR